MRIVFCGVGALGSTAAIFCRNLNATLCFVDFDRVESKNVLAQAYVKQSIGKNKAEALKLQFQNFYGVKAESFGVKLVADNVEALCGSADLLVDCFDNKASRELLSGFARKAGKPLVHAAVSGDGTFGIVRWDERFAPDAEDQPGQATCEGGEHLPLIGLLGTTLARAIQDFLKSGMKRDAMVSLNAVTPTAS
ncbi:HesA/MoeB/ThiF family protein [Hyalangium minutum]|uniref:Sulfur carrier protein adenylyltransferase ThiF n=1 Tax=Hyalangium minutum TaxID=394096 RepID=A0A085VYR2_9BACT|nr:ThiF family adenylyltransferase [Hyalangium minutum]KFE60575.1 Sulfur carrier protein adenylyltransferase ThiF [Hyalangium minutum]